MLKEEFSHPNSLGSHCGILISLGGEWINVQMMLLHYKNMSRKMFICSNINKKGLKEGQFLSRLDTAGVGDVFWVKSFIILCLSQAFVS